MNGLLNGAGRPIVLIGTFVLPMASTAAVVYDEEGTTLDVYGNLQLAWFGVERPSGEGDVDSLAQLGDNGSTIGFRGRHAISSELEGYFRYELEADADEIKTGAGIDTGDQAYVGLSGRFGDVRVGSWDVLIDDWIQDPISNNEFFDVTDSNGVVEGDDGVNTQGETDTDREGDRFQYLSPSFAGVQLAIGLQYKGEGESENIDDADSAALYAGVEYASGPYRAAFVYDSLDNLDGDVTGRRFVDANGVPGPSFDPGDRFGIAAGYTRDTLRVALKVERYESGDEDFVPSETRYALGVRYGYGYGDVYGAYQFVDVGDSGFADTLDPLGGGGSIAGDRSDETFNEFVLGSTYMVSDSLYTFAEAAFYDREDSVGDGVALGVAYLF